MKGGGSLGVGVGGGRVSWGGNRKKSKFKS